MTKSGDKQIEEIIAGFFLLAVFGLQMLLGANKPGKEEAN